MQWNNRIKLLSITMGILLFGGAMQTYAASVSPSDIAASSQGASAWANNCARCHNPRSPVEFTPAEWRVIMLHMRIQGGLTGQEARNIYAFLSAQSASTQAPASNSQTETQPAVDMTPGSTKTLSKSKPVHSQQAGKTSQTTSTQAGKAIYHQTCIACHGANGKGVIPGAPDFTSRNSPLSKSDALLLKHIENGFQSPGSPMAMPPKGGNPSLTKDDLQNALSYIRSTFGSK